MELEITLGLLNALRTPCDRYAECHKCGATRAVWKQWIKGGKAEYFCRACTKVLLRAA